MSIYEDYYKPVLLKSGYNNNYVQYESKGDRILAIHEYLALIEKYLRELINLYKNKGEWKIQLTAPINFVSLAETRVMYARSFNEGSDTDEVIKSFFESFLKIYDLNLQEKMKWHYLTVKNLSGLLRGITSNHNADFYCLNCFCAYSTKNKLEKHKKNM